MDELMYHVLCELLIFSHRFNLVVNVIVCSSTVDCLSLQLSQQLIMPQ